MDEWKPVPAMVVDMTMASYEHHFANVTIGSKFGTVWDSYCHPAAWYLGDAAGKKVMLKTLDGLIGLHCSRIEGRINMIRQMLEIGRALGPNDDRCMQENAKDDLRELDDIEQVFTIDTHIRNLWQKWSQVGQQLFKQDDFKHH